MSANEVESERTVELDQLFREVDTTLALTHGEKVNICYALFKIIESGPRQEQHLILRHLAENWDFARSSDEIKIDAYINQNEKDLLRDKYGEVINKLFELILKENLPEDQFYASLWRVLHNPILPDDKAQAFALYWVMIDRRIPYFQLETGLRMANEDFKAAFTRIMQKAAKIRFILGSQFDQKSEEADLVLKTIDAAAPHPDRVALMAYILEDFRRREARLMRERASTT